MYVLAYVFRDSISNRRYILVLKAGEEFIDIHVSMIDREVVDQV